VTQNRVGGALPFCEQKQCVSVATKGDLCHEPTDFPMLRMYSPCAFAAEMILALCTHWFYICDVMIQRAGIWFMLIWAIAWFVFIVPGHTRGIIQLAPDPFAASEGKQAEAAQSCGDCCSGPKNSSSKDKPAKPFMGKCALCDNVSKTVGAEPFTIDLPLIGMIKLLEPPAVFTLSGVQFLIDQNSRGPPSFPGC
jgi:hypothetical protein